MQEKALQCRFATAAWGIYDSGENPQWVLDAETPVKVGGKVGFLLAYLLGIYTILHIARAYKRFILSVRSLSSWLPTWCSQTQCFRCVYQPTRDPSVPA